MLKYTRFVSSVCPLYLRAVGAGGLTRSAQLQMPKFKCQIKPKIPMSKRNRTLKNEIATARQVGPRNDKTKSLEFVEFIEFVGFIEIGVIRSSMRPPGPPLFPFSVTLVSFEFSLASRTESFC